MLEYALSLESGLFDYTWNGPTKSGRGIAI